MNNALRIYASLIFNVIYKILLIYVPAIKADRYITSALSVAQTGYFLVGMNTIIKLKTT